VLVPTGCGEVSKGYLALPRSRRFGPYQIKQIINGKCYDTEKAMAVAAEGKETLYVTDTNAWFLKYWPDDDWDARDHQLKAISKHEAFAWLEWLEKTEELDTYLPDMIEEA
jgi:hypothetical protein